MKLSERLDVVATVLIAGVAIVVLIQRGATSEDPTRPPPLLAEWRAMSEEGIWSGARDAPVVITEFVDFQCPFCALVGQVIDSVQARHGGRVAVALHHLPLATHTQAVPAAIAVECADRQARARELVRAIYRDQEALRDRPLVEFALVADLPDLAAFEACMALPVDSFPRIARGIELAGELRVHATPTMWVNGKQVGQTSLPREVDAALGRANR